MCVSSLMLPFHCLINKRNDYPKFNDTNASDIEKYMHEFYSAVGARLIQEDVAMMLFSLTLEVNAMDWYLSLPQGSLTN